MRRLGLKVLTLVVVAVLLLPVVFAWRAEAAAVRIVLDRGVAYVYIIVSADLSKFSLRDVCFYKDFSMMLGKALYHGSIVSGFARAVEAWLRMHGVNASVVNASLSLSILEEPAIGYAIPVFFNASGALVDGKVSDLLVVDGRSLVIEATGPSSILFRYVFAGRQYAPSPDRVQQVNVTLTAYGNATTIGVAVYNYTSSSWVNTTVDLSANASTVTAVFNGSGLISRDGSLTITLYTNSTGNVTIYIDRMAVTIRYLMDRVYIEAVLVLANVARKTLTGMIYDLRFRYMNPDVNASTPVGVLNPSRMLFLNFTGFNVPLEKWNRVFNGTHTIFNYTSTAVLVHSPWGRLLVDPEMYIIVPGHASAAGDEIIVESVPSSLVAAGAFTASLLFFAAAVRVAKHSIMGMRRRYVRRT